jgi:hypothetical protein
VKEGEKTRTKKARDCKDAISNAKKNGKNT